MAKILTTAIVADIRNKLNGSVFSKNRYGSYVRTKVTPVNPQTAAQQLVRNRLATNSAAWRALTQAQRDGWINAAPNFPVIDIFGNSKILSGNALYVQMNNNLAAIGVAAISDAPAPASVPALVLTSLTAAAGSPALSLVFTPTPVTTGFSLLVEATPNVGPGILYVKNKFRVTEAIAAASSSPANLLTAYALKFGNPVEAMRISVRVRFINATTGQAGIPVTVTAIVAA